MIKQKYLLYIAILISIITYMFWKPLTAYFGFPVFYIGMALFIHLLAIYIWRDSHRSSIPAFILFSLSINNLLDELFYDPTKFQTNEIYFLIITIIYSIKIHRDATRQRDKTIHN